MSKKGDTVEDVLDLEKEIQDALDHSDGLADNEDAPALDADDEMLEAVAEAVDDQPSDASVDDGEESDPPGGDEPEAEASDDPPEPKPDDPADPDKSDEPKADAEADKPDDKPSDEPERPSDKFGKLDESVPEKTRERFDSLRKGYDDLDERFRKVQSEQEQWLDAISDVNATPEQLGTALAYIGDVNAATPERLSRAYDLMAAELSELGKRLGKEAPGHDPLDAHPDLRQRVEEGDISRADANELAQFRASKQLNDAASQQQERQQSEQNEHQQAMHDIGQLGAKLRASDPDYAAKLPALEKVVSSVMSSGLPKSKWAETIESLYPTIASPTPAPRPRPPADTPSPISGTGASAGGGGMDKEPGSMLEAVDMALGSARV